MMWMTMTMMAMLRRTKTTMMVMRDKDSRSYLRIKVAEDIGCSGRKNSFDIPASNRIKKTFMIFNLTLNTDNASFCDKTWNVFNKV